MTYLLVLYFFLYRLALLLAIPLICIVLSHTDRVHMRERARRLGCSIKHSISSVGSFGFFKSFGTMIGISDTKIQTIDLKVRLYILRPLCVLIELFAGFAEGAEDLQPIMMIAEPYSSYRMEMNRLDISNLRTIENPKDNDNIDTRENQINTTDKTDRPTFNKIESSSYKSIANSIIDRSGKNQNEIDDDIVYISTKDNSSNDSADDASDNDSDSESDNESNRENDNTDSEPEESEESEEPEESEESEESDESQDRDRISTQTRSDRKPNRKVTVTNERKTVRVKRIAPKGARPKITLARRR